MGADGAAGMTMIRGKNGPTFAQSPESCVVSGMPTQAIQMGGVAHVGTPQEIGRTLCQLLNVQPREHEAVV